VVKVIRHKTASLPQTDGSVVFARWRQCLHMGGHIGATWRIRLNLCFQTANRLVQLFSHRWPHSVPILCNGRPFPQNCPFPREIWTAHDSLGPSQPTNQTASLSVQPFLHRWPQSVPIPHNGTPLPLPFKIAPSHGGSGPHLIHGSLGPPESSTQMASRSVQPF